MKGVGWDWTGVIGALDAEHKEFIFVFLNKRSVHVNVL